MSNKAPCPLCGGLIDPNSFTFICPACKTVDEKFSFMSNCSFCRFGPNFISCMHCRRDFELWLLLGNYTNDRGEILPPQTKQLYDANFRYSLQELNPGISVHAGETMGSFPPAALLALAQVSVGFPIRVSRATIHTAHNSVDNRYWLHFHVFHKIDHDTKPFGQVTLVYNDPTRLAACAVNEIFYCPR